MSNEGCSWMTGSVLKEEATLEMAVQGLSSLVHLLEARPTSHRSKRQISSQFLRIRSSSRHRRSCELSFKAPSKGGCDAWRAAEHAAQHCSQGVGLVLTQSQGGLDVVKIWVSRAKWKGLGALKFKFGEEKSRVRRWIPGSVNLLDFLTLC